MLQRKISEKRVQKKTRKTQIARISPRLIHADVGELFFLRKTKSGKFVVFGHNLNSGKFDRFIAELNPKDSVLLALQNCASIIAHEPRKGVIAIAHTIHPPISAEAKQAHILEHSNADIVLERTLAESRRFPQQYAHVDLTKLPGRAKAMASMVKRPAYFADDAVKAIVNELGNRIVLDLTGGFSRHGEKPDLIQSIESELSKHGINQINIDSTNVGGTNPKIFQFRPNLLTNWVGEIHIGRLKFFVSLPELIKLAETAEHVNKPEGIEF